MKTATSRALAPKDTMNIDWLHFTPWSSLLGGVLLGLAAALLVLLRGRVLGVSGIVSGWLRFAPGDLGWRSALLAGMLCAPILHGLFLSAPTVRIDAGWSTLLLAGLLVGLGTGWARGCTSGHGVCGLARRSPRSLVATLSFMGAGLFTVYAVRHLLA